MAGSDRLEGRVSLETLTDLAQSRDLVVAKAERQDDRLIGRDVVHQDPGSSVNVLVVLAQENSVGIISISDNGLC